MNRKKVVERTPCAGLVVAIHARDASVVSSVLRTLDAKPLSFAYRGVQTAVDLDVLHDRMARQLAEETVVSRDGDATLPLEAAEAVFREDIANRLRAPGFWFFSDSSRPLLASLWDAALESIEIRGLRFLGIRSPRASVLDLETSFRLPRAAGYELWTRFVLASALSSAPRDTFVFEVDGSASDWADRLIKTAEWGGFEWPRDPGAALNDLAAVLGDGACAANTDDGSAAIPAIAQDVFDTLRGGALSADVHAHLCTIRQRIAAYDAKRYGSEVEESGGFFDRECVRQIARLHGRADAVKNPFRSAPADASDSSTAAVAEVTLDAISSARQVRVLEGELRLERLRSEDYRTRLERALAGQASEIKARRRVLEERDDLGRQLSEERQSLATLQASRSWRMTQPLRSAKRFLGARRTFDEARFEPAPDLAPGRVLRQPFRAPVSVFDGLGIHFFTYERENRSRVRVRVSRTGFSGRRSLVHDEEIDPGRVADRQVTFVQFAHPERVRRFARYELEIEALDTNLGSRLTVGAVPAYLKASDLSLDGERVRSGYQVALFFSSGESEGRKKAFAFISGCPGDAFRYRCEHQAESLRLMGYTVDVWPADTFPWDRLASGYHAVVAHRVPYTRAFERFVERARQRGVSVIFDTDDLVFDLEVLPQLEILKEMSEDERELFEDGVRRYREALSHCSSVSVSTPALAAAARRHYPDLGVELTRNRVSDEMREIAEALSQSERRNPAEVRLGYFSGTRTHRVDFDQCVEALTTILETYPEVRLVLVGHIEVPPVLRRYRDRIDDAGLVPWRELPALISEVDVNLAPLEPHNPFTECKSELKFVEAGLCSVPTVASRVGGYRDAVEDGVTGYLCSNRSEWENALSALVSDPDHRRRMGEAARRAASEHSSTRALAPATAKAFHELLDPGEPRPLRVAFVLRAPIAETGGGYKKIFQLAHYLAERDHQIDVYVEPIAHLARANEAQIQRFCSEHFGESAVLIHRGHDAIRECDVAVATNWPTANVVVSLENAALLTYFVQDYEPEFYAEGDPLREEAEATYDLPLRAITIGSYLAKRLGRRNRISYPHVPFALSPHFFEEREEIERGLRSGPPRTDSVLFFARPEIPRRRFELGLEALAQLAEKRPGVEIRLYGAADLPSLPFPATNLGVLDPSALVAAMRDAAVHLSFSSTNASTVLFEAMATGCAAVDLDQEGVRDLVPAHTCCLVDPEADAVSRAIADLLADNDRRAALALRGLEATRSMDVESMCAAFEAILLEESLASRQHQGS